MIEKWFLGPHFWLPFILASFGMIVFGIAYSNQGIVVFFSASFVWTYLMWVAELAQRNRT